MLKMYTALGIGVVILIAGVTLPIAICNSKSTALESSPGASNLKQGFRESPQSVLHQFSQTSNGGVLLEAVNFLVSHKMTGDLPGVAADEHVAIDFPWLVRGTNDGTWHYRNTNFGGYPVTLTFTLHATDSSDRYCYTVAKASMTNSWQLKKAWLTDTNGRVVEEFSTD